VNKVLVLTGCWVLSNIERTEQIVKNAGIMDVIVRAEQIEEGGLPKPTWPEENVSVVGCPFSSSSM